MSRLVDIGKIARMNDLNGDLLLGELDARSAVEERISGIVKKAEDRLKTMYGKRFFDEKAHLLHPAMFMLTENVDC